MPPVNAGPSGPPGSAELALLSEIEGMVCGALGAYSLIGTQKSFACEDRGNCGCSHPHGPAWSLSVTANLASQRPNKVMQQYFDVYFARAIQLAKGQQLARQPYTCSTGSWLLYKYLEQADTAQLEGCRTGDGAGLSGP